MPTHITDYLFENATKLPEKPALYFNQEHYTWSQFANTIKVAAAHVSPKLPIDKQVIVGIFMPNSVDFLRAYLGVIHAGHIAMPMDPNFKPMEVQNVLDQMKPAFTITSAEYQNFFRSADAVMLANELSQEISTEDIKLLRLDPKTQAASMLFTSGTTGNPKAVPYTHANHMWNIPVVTKLWKWSEKDTILLSLALSHWHGLVMGLDGALYHGNTIYLQERFDPEATITALQSGDISLFMHVPIAYAKLVEYAGQKTFDISKVRLCISGSSYLPPKLWQSFKNLFGQEILERYGANEMGLLTSNRLDERIPGCVGYPLEGVTIELQEDGEIAMRSPGLFPGYWNNNEATQAQRLPNGLWLSGDIGEFDEAGRLHLKGRVQEKMKKKGITVYPRDVEWAIMQHPKVQEAAVMGLQHEDSLDDEFIYFVVGDASDEEIHDFCKKKMPVFWRPDKIIHIDAIPRTGRTSKPALKELRALIE
jgi:acyl-CoA synthetase (AMP-forming)/AMP-acid ligase II